MSKSNRLYCWLVLLCVTFLFPFSAPLLAQKVVTKPIPRLIYAQGKYEACLKHVSELIAKEERPIDDHVWRLQCLMTLGRYSQAQSALKVALSQHRTSIEIRFLAYRIYQANSEPKLAEQQLDLIDNMVRRAPWNYSDPSSQITLGRFLLLRGADPRQVLELVFDRVRKAAPKVPETYLATAELAISKDDYAEAVRSLQQGQKLATYDPRFDYLLAKAYRSSDPKKTNLAIQAALKKNSRHVPSLLLIADHAIDSEQYEQAKQLLQEVLAINLQHPDAWSYHAVLAHLHGDYKAEQTLRMWALTANKKNPAVDHLIGRKLSAKYRFEEGAKYQRKALTLDPNFIAAKIQLSQDLLRLGKEREGWELADSVNKKDAYNVLAHNLVTLHEQIRRFRTLKRGPFVVRMERKEAAIYGEQVLDLLIDAHKTLTKKYDTKVKEPIIVEIFPQQKDFAIRTFGLPGGSGFLGVCFGTVITANSPASQADNPSNWRAVLWHEFCHVVTLQKTKNRMPRWLSEGISVYEERQANSAWGESMSPQYRQMVLGKELTPISQLSGAFLQPKSGLHLQFAYFESSLVVEFIIKRFGVEKLNAILRDLGVGIPINVALGRHTGSLPVLETEFAKYAKDLAKKYGEKLDWKEAKLPPRASPTLISAWLKQHPDSYEGLTRLAAAHLQRGQWGQAKVPLKRLIELCPDMTSGLNPLLQLSMVHRRLGERDQETAVLERLVKRDDSQLAAYLRLAEIHHNTKSWQGVYDNARRALAVNPLVRRPHELMASAAKVLKKSRDARLAYRAILELDAPDPALIHLELAQLYDAAGQTTLAKRHVLMSLEEAPRYRAAHKLLLKLVGKPKSRQGTDAKESR